MRPCELRELVGRAAGPQLVSLALAGGELGGIYGCGEDLFSSCASDMYPRLEVLKLAFKLSRHSLQEDALLAVISALAKECEAWPPTLRELSARVALSGRLPADVVQRARACCAELSAACARDDKKLAFELVLPG